jgi:dipeptidase E
LHEAIDRCRFVTDNISSYNLDYLLSYEEGKLYDAIYFCGGDTAHLLNSINAAGFNHVLNRLVSEGMFYLGVSAGSIVAADNLPGNLGYVNCKLSVHCQYKSLNGTLKHGDTICLSDQQAIWITDDKAEIIE